MKLTVIGYSGAYPKKGIASSCYLVSDGDTKVILDMGSGSLSIMQKYVDLIDIDAVIISHFHADHFVDALCFQHAVLVDMQRGNRVKATPVPIYAYQDNCYFDKMNFRDCTKAIEINKSSKLKIGSLQFEFAETKHAVYGLAIKVTDGRKIMVYTSDSEKTENLTEFCKGCDLLLGECSIYREYENAIKGHMSAKTLSELAVISGAKKLVVTHLPVYGDNDELINDITQNYKLPVFKAQEGLEIKI